MICKLCKKKIIKGKNYIFDKFFYHPNCYEIKDKVKCKYCGMFKMRKSKLNKKEYILQYSNTSRRHI